MDYIELTVDLNPRVPFTEIFIGALGEEGFESFVETENGFKAYISEANYHDGMEADSWAWQLDNVEVKSNVNRIPRQNWNAAWEESFEPILVKDKVYIYAPFHTERKDIPYQILIEPKMSFGTGHHATTHLMIEQMLQLNLAGKTVLDMGCGTGILAILSMQRGAKKTVAIDVDDWSIENTLENAQRNGVQLETKLGGAQEIGNQKFDIILANINLNVLLEDLPVYAHALVGGGCIVLSGFYQEDLKLLSNNGESVGLELVSADSRDNWHTAVFLKKLKAIKFDF